VTGDGFVSIGAIEGNGLKSIAAVKSDVLGRIDLSGPLGSLRVRDIRGAAFIRTAGNATGKSTIVAHVIESGVAIEFATSVALFHAAAVGAGSISAPSIGILTVTGDARNRVGGVLTPIQGDFRANLSLTGTGDPRKPIALGLARIFGSVLDANWNVNGAANYIIAKNWIGGSIVADSLGTLWIKEDFSGDLSLIGNGVLPGKPVLKSASIGRAVEGSDIQIGGTVNKFIAGAMIDCALFVGFTPTDSGDPFAGGIFKLGARLNLFRVVGIKGVPEPAFENSIVAATLFGTVSFKSINPTNSTRFGLLADIGFENLAIGAPIFKLKKINTTPILDPVFGDFEISVI
jgi:hypothetical protein